MFKLLTYDALLAQASEHILNLPEKYATGGNPIIKILF